VIALEIARLTNAIAETGHSRSVIDAIMSRDRESEELAVTIEKRRRVAKNIP
jgi:hypothetical protein